MLAQSCSLLLTLVLLGAAGDNEPQVRDARLKLTLLAANPDIVTPTGIAVDGRGRVLVIESHTHFRPQDYVGPAADRILLMEDTNGDGRADRIGTFFEGTTHTMNLAVYNDGSVFVATRAEVFRLRDTNGDGKADERVRIAHLETSGDYPHNGLSGFAFDFAGNVYFGFGENLGATYKLIGSDGTTLPGGGEGGNIYRCRPDGSRLARVATGFWNPFHVCFDAFGRLFTVDNDPDSRPPCRLLHIVEGGDYGYRFRNGRKGLHPFTAWNGELPGTLPMIAGTGEAPSGVVAYESDNLPDEYRGDLLVTSWGDHRIERYRLDASGASFTAAMTPVVTGGENFRPVGIAVAPDGSVYFSDWVDKSYQLHGKGRVWRLSRTESTTPNRPDEPRAALASPDRAWREAAARRLAAGGQAGVRVLDDVLRTNDQPRIRALALTALAAADSENSALVRKATEDESVDVRALAVSLATANDLDLNKLADPTQPPLVRAAALRQMASEPFVSTLLACLDDTDPFIQQAARFGLARTKAISPDFDVASLSSPAQRAGVTLLLRESGDARAREVLPKLLADKDPTVRFLAIQWIGEENLREYRPQVEQALTAGDSTRQLFEACLAALERLDGVVRSPREEAPGEAYVLRVLLDENASPVLRRRALRTLRPDHPQLTMGLLLKLLQSPDDELRLETIRSLREISHPQTSILLRAIAVDSKAPVVERAEAIMGLRAEIDGELIILVGLAGNDSPEVAQEALRSLRGTKLVEQADQLQLQFAQARLNKSPHLKEMLDRVLQPNHTPTTPDVTDTPAWLALLEGPADAQAGQRIFFHGRVASCYRCHQMDGRGASVGPDLTAAGRSFTRQRLVESILQPSREIAPQFTAWGIVTASGQQLTGLLIGHELDGTQRYLDNTGKEFRLKPTDIEDRRPHPQSIMPAGLEKTMTLQELRDLLAYLQSTR
jgi:putative membrane-bound dehydrogenase-like protein